MAGQVIASELITAAQAGEDALEAVVREHARLVYRVAYAVVRNHHDAEDVTQETFLRVWRWRKKLDAVRDVKSWLSRIAWRIAVDRARKKPTVTLDEVESDSDSTLPTVACRISSSVICCGNKSGIELAANAVSVFRYWNEYRLFCGRTRWFRHSQ